MVIHKMRRGALDKQIRKDFERNCSSAKRQESQKSIIHLKRSMSYLSNCLPAPPLAQQQSTDDKPGLMSG